MSSIDEEAADDAVRARLDKSFANLTFGGLDAVRPSPPIPYVVPLIPEVSGYLKACGEYRGRETDEKAVLASTIGVNFAWEFEGEPDEECAVVRYLSVNPKKHAARHGIGSEGVLLAVQVARFGFDGRGRYGSHQFHLALASGGRVFVNGARSTDAWASAAVHLVTDMHVRTYMAWAVDFSYVNSAAPLRIHTDALGVRELLASRDAPPRGRRSPIAHWVRKHARVIRRAGSDDVEREVRAYLRGARSGQWDGLTFSVHPSVVQPGDASVSVPVLRDRIVDDLVNRRKTK